VDSLLGTQLYETPDITGAQKQLINERDVARHHKDWQKSDELRDRLVAEGIGLRDHDGHTTVWYYL
jgi:cysteinyl-tRNA synthetase